MIKESFTKEEFESIYQRLLTGAQERSRKNREAFEKKYNARPPVPKAEMSEFIAKRIEEANKRESGEMRYERKEIDDVHRPWGFWV